MNVVNPLMMTKLLVTLAVVAVLTVILVSKATFTTNGEVMVKMK